MYGQDGMMMVAYKLWLTDSTFLVWCGLVYNIGNGRDQSLESDGCQWPCEEYIQDKGPWNGPSQSGVICTGKVFAITSPYCCEEAGLYLLKELPSLFQERGAESRYICTSCHLRWKGLFCYIFV